MRPFGDDGLGQRIHTWCSSVSFVTVIFLWSMLSAFPGTVRQLSVYRHKSRENNININVVFLIVFISHLAQNMPKLTPLSYFVTIYL